jgi:hypothetical protein
MSREKQIEEMARVMCEDCADYGDCKYNICDAVRDSAKTLYNAGYSKQSENVIELPCKVGQKVYVITEKHPCFACKTVADYCHRDCSSFGDRTELIVKEGIVEGILLFSTNKETRIAIPTTKHLMRHYITKRFSEYGKTVFFTQKEAKQALAKMKGGAE